MSFISTMASATLIKTGQTVTVSFDATPGDYGFEWTTTNSTLQLSPAATICNVYCKAPFSGTAIVKCTYKFRVGSSYTTLSKSWSFTYNSSGDGGGGGGNTGTGTVKLSTTSVDVQEYKTASVTIDQSLDDINWTVFDSSIAKIEPKYGGFLLEITGCKPGTTYARVTGKYMYNQVLEGLVCINVSKRNYQDGELITYKTSDVNLDFKVIDGKGRTASLSGVNWLLDESKFEIPSQVEGLTITQIGISSGSKSVLGNYKNKIKKVVIPSTVQVINDYAFAECSSLEEVTIPSSVNTLGLCAFYKCTSLDNLYLPGSLQWIGNESFMRCSSLKNVYINDGIKELGNGMFEYCPSIEVIRLPESLETIGSYCFVNCTNLKDIYIQSNLRRINDLAFARCNNLTKVYISDLSSWCKIHVELQTAPLLYADLIYKNECIEHLVVPHDVQIIGEGAFRYYKKLKSVYIPKSVTDIENYAFYECSGLTTVTFENDTPPNVSDDTFKSTSYDNVKLVVPANSVNNYKRHKVWGLFKTIESVSGQDSPDEFSYQGVNYVVLDRDAGTCQTKPGTYSNSGSSVSGNLVIPSAVSNGRDTFKVVSIGFCSFTGNTELTSIELPSTVRIIGDYAFECCENLSEVKLSNGLTSIGEDAFYFTNISSIVLPSTLNEIKMGAFAFSKLSDVFIPKSVSLIEPGAFLCATFLYNNGIIKNITVDSGNMNYTSNDGVLFDKAINTLLCFPAGKIQDKYIIPTTVRTIEDRSFQASQVSSIVIPNTATKIGELSFACSQLKSINIPKDIQEIGLYAFSYCDYLSEIYYNTNNPISIYYEIFDTEHYANATLYVPAESVNKFKKTVPWKYFNKIEAYKFSRVETVIADSEPPVYFDLQGLRVETPVKGRLYIRLQNGKAEKMVIK